jgi:hypothetical protein
MASLTPPPPHNRSALLPDTQPVSEWGRGMFTDSPAPRSLSGLANCTFFLTLLEMFVKLARFLINVIVCVCVGGGGGEKKSKIEKFFFLIK